MQEDSFWTGKGLIRLSRQLWLLFLLLVCSLALGLVLSVRVVRHLLDFTSF